jgi:hypothetical protein
MSVYTPTTPNYDARTQLLDWQALTGWLCSDPLPSACPIQMIHGRHRHPGDCWEVDRPDAFDHIYRVKRRGERGMLVMPYDFGDWKAAELSAWCDQHDAEWMMYGTGWWYWHTTAIVITARREARQLRRDNPIDSLEWTGEPDR